MLFSYLKNYIVFSATDKKIQWNSKIITWQVANLCGVLGNKLLSHAGFKDVQKMQHTENMIPKFPNFKEK